MMEKLGIKKQQLKEELQAEYSRKKSQEHELHKTGAAAPLRAQAANELAAIKESIDELDKK